MKKLFTVFALILALALCFTACAPASENNQPLAQGGVLRLSVNPEIAVFFDESGNVTKVEARNDDAAKILADYKGYEGKSCRNVVAELVSAIGQAGYLVEEVEGERRKITLEIEPGSQVPDESFLAEIASTVQSTVDSNQWSAPVEATKPQKDVSNTCTNPNCKDDDCDDLVCDAGVCTNPYCDDRDCDDADCDDGVKDDKDDVRTCTNPNCKDADCDDRVCDAGVCTNPHCDDRDCDDADCDDGVKDDKDDVRTCTNPNCKDDDCDDLVCDAGVCTNPYCDDRDCDDADCDDGPNDDDDEDEDDDDEDDDDDD